MSEITRCLLACSAFFLGFTVAGQNLVPNWSFEDHTLCPDYWNEVERATGWHKSMTNNDGDHHTDYLNACGMSTFQVPGNMLGNQPASTGNAYMLLATIAPTIYTDYRENIYIQLIEPLEMGLDYDVHLKASLADYCQHATNDLGVKFSTSPSFPIDGHSQVFSSSIITNKLSWTEISGSFTADSAYAYIAVGNFFTDAATLTSTPCSTCSSPLHSYYIDDVCVLPKHASSGDCTTAYIPAGIHISGASSNAFRIIPTGDGLTVVFIEPLQGTGEISIVDMEGRLIQRIPVHAGQSSSGVEAPIAPGTYLIALTNGGVRSAQRFVKL